MLRLFVWPREDEPVMVADEDWLIMGQGVRASVHGPSTVVPSLHHYAKMILVTRTAITLEHGDGHCERIESTGEARGRESGAAPPASEEETEHATV